MRMRAFVGLRFLFSLFLLLSILFFPFIHDETAVCVTVCEDVKIKEAIRYPVRCC